MVIFGGHTGDWWLRDVAALHIKPYAKTPTTAVQVCDPGAKTTRYLGDSCVAGTDTCCPVTSSVICEDLVCVPSTDGTGAAAK